MTWKFQPTPGPTGLPLPESISPTEIKHMSGGYVTVSGTLVYWYELHYNTGSRWKRCFVAHATIGSMTKPHLVIALPGSNSNIGANGAKDFIVPPAGDTQQQWPLQLCAQHGVFAVMIDLPKFGAFPYQDDPTNAIDPLVDTICGVMAARWFIEETYSFKTKLSRAMFVGGWSWGCILAEYLAASIPNITHAYLSCGQMSKEYDPRPMFRPWQWGWNYDYKDMLLAAKAKMRIQFGGNGQDYLYTPFRAPSVPDVDSVLSELTTCAPNRFSTVISPTLGHAIDVADLTSWFPQFINSASWYVDPSPI